MLGLLLMINVAALFFFVKRAIAVHKEEQAYNR